MEKNILKILALAVLLILAATAIYVYRPVKNDLTRITVIGDSQTKIAPDTSVITFSVVTQATQAVDAQQQNAKKSEAIRAAVRSVIGDADAEIKTSGYALDPERDYSAKMPKIVGYEVENTVTVTIKSLDQVGAIIDAATNAGANSVDGIQFIIGEASPAQGEALSLATKQAMAKAESIAASLNGKIVRVVETRESGLPSGIDRDSEFKSLNANANTAMAKPTFSTPVEAGSLNVRSQVVLVVDIKR